MYYPIEQPISPPDAPCVCEQCGCDFDDNGSEVCRDCCRDMIADMDRDNED